MEETITIHKAKVEVQEEGRDALIYNNGGIIAVATGGGKSKMAIDFCAYTQEDISAPLRIMIAVPTEKLRDVEWPREFQKWWPNMPEAVVVERYCYASINKLKDKIYDITILDEIQNITPNNAKFFDNNNYGEIVGLSATPPNEIEKKEILNRLHLKVVYKLSLDEAVERGIVAPYELIFVEMNLDSKKKYIEAGSKVKKWMTTEKRQYDYFSSTIKNAEMGFGRRGSIKYLRLNRMRFVYNLDSKYRVAAHMLKHVIPKEERTLILTGSIKMAEALEKNTFHSKSNDIAFDKFMEGEINKLSAVDSLSEGVNIPNLDNALIVQVKTKERHLIQKIGRIIRWREGHTAKIYIMYVKGTVDEEWMNKATENIDKSSVNLIKFTV